MRITFIKQRDTQGQKQRILPETTETDIVLTGVREGQAFATGELPYACITRISPGMKAEVEPEGMKGKASVILSEKTLLERILHS